MDFFSFSDAGWSTLDDASEVRGLIEKISPIDGRLELNDQVVVRTRSLPMYERVVLLCLTHDDWQDDLRICYLADGEDLYRLNGTSPPIHEVNAKAPVQITDDNVFYYLSFFCFFVRGEEGPFYIVHDLDDPLLPAGFADLASSDEPETRNLRRLFRSPRAFGQDGNGHWRASALVFYSNAVFAADFLVQPTGMIEMADDDPLLADLPSRVRAPLAPGVQSS